MCYSWNLKGAPASGHCRRACSPDIQCGHDEACMLGLHDSSSFEEMKIARLCLPSVAPSDCDNQGCRDCELDMVGTTFCEEDSVRGWLLAFEPVCGLTCRSVTLAMCNPSTCAETESGAICENRTFLVDDLCKDYSCSSCGDEPGAFYCEDNKLMACLSAPVPVSMCEPDCACEMLCTAETIAICSTCVEDGKGGVRCDGRTVAKDASHDAVSASWFLQSGIMTVER
ncbi:MAG: hypothetical protein V2A73_17465 [Pseudomonadota bacterium]